MLKPHEIGRCLTLASDLETRYPADLRAIACMLVQLEQNIGQDGMAAGARKDLCRVAARIWDLMPSADEPRFSLHDYADAIANARNAVSPAKLLAVPDDEFVAAMIWLATDKRETYEEQEHAQEPLEIDIYEKGGETHAGD